MRASARRLATDDVLGREIRMDVSAQAAWLLTSAACSSRNGTTEALDRPQCVLAGLCSYRLKTWSYEEQVTATS